MIRLLYGENSFLIERALQQITKAAEAAEVIDGSELSAGQLADALGGMSLFTPNRTVIIKYLSENTALWPEASAFFERVGDADVVLVEANLDKRTKTYKWLKKQANSQEYLALSNRDPKQVSSWIETEASNIGLDLTAHQVRRIYERVGVSQWELYHALEKLVLLPNIDDEIIDTIIEPHPNENVFVLLETCLNGDVAGVQRMLSVLKLTDEPYRVFGLLSGQIVQLAALVHSGGAPASVVASDLGVSSYVLGNLTPFATRLTTIELGELIEAFALTDDRMKRSDADAWTLIENLLAKVASR